MIPVFVRRRAFTLIELLVVIIIIAVMAGVVVPAYVRFMEKARYQAKVREVQDLFAYAREQAVVNDTTVTVHFDPQSETFVATVPSVTLTTDQPAVFANAQEADAATTQTAPKGMTVHLEADQKVAQFQASSSGGTNPSGQGQGGQGSLNELDFQGDGTVEGAEIRIVDQSGRMTHMILWPSTGLLTLEDSVGQQ